jgi:hypothetical protein
MSTIIAAHFQLQDDIDQARRALAGAGFPEDGISSLVEGAATGGVVGAALGAATIPVTGPLGPVVGGLVGAHVGSLFSLSKMKEAGEGGEGEAENLRTPRKPGMLIAVALGQPADEGRALEVLRRLGAHQIERAEGTIAGGDWTDFDPTSTPVPVP